MQAFMEYKFENNESKILTMIVEPWAEEFSIPPGSALTLKIFNTTAGPIDTEINKDYFVIWLWRGCRVQVSIDGKDQTPSSLSIPAFG